MGQSILNTVKYGEVSVCDTMQKGIAIIETTQDQLQVIVHYPDQGNSEYTADPTYGKSMSCRLLIDLAFPPWLPSLSMAC